MPDQAIPLDGNCNKAILDRIRLWQQKSPVSYGNSQGKEERRTGMALYLGSVTNLMQIVLVVTIDGVDILDHLSLAVVRLSVKLQHSGWGP